MSPVAKQHTAAFDEITRVNQNYGKDFPLSFSRYSRCLFYYEKDLESMRMI